MTARCRVPIPVSVSVSVSVARMALKHAHEIPDTAATA